MLGLPFYREPTEKLRARCSFKLCPIGGECSLLAGLDPPGPFLFTKKGVRPVGAAHADCRICFSRRFRDDFSCLEAAD